MAIETTPPLLACGSDQEYIDRLRLEYQTKKIIVPEGRTVIFFLNSDKDCMHFLGGKNSKKINRTRAQHILFVKYILETTAIRQVKRHIETGNIVFYSEELSIVVVCSEMKRGDLHCFTYHPVKSSQKQNFYNQNKYVDFGLN
ncbi:MAG: hypothetical protein K9M44_04145 [Candidatus Pacebacteria bacterium]|nr:hypothetical protein [Candidatus Paceibacterota bacterium]MCF7900587.1 hypothetical protein [Candidatus Babeliales bacterium]